MRDCNHKTWKPAKGYHFADGPYVEYAITEEDKANVSNLEKEYPGAMPYFFSQDPDYITVKERVSDYCANGTEAKGIATVDIACETLRVAEYLVPVLQEQLK